MNKEFEVFVEHVGVINVKGFEGEVYDPSEPEGLMEFRTTNEDGDVMAHFKRVIAVIEHPTKEEVSGKEKAKVQE